MRFAPRCGAHFSAAPKRPAAEGSSRSWCAVGARSRTASGTPKSHRPYLDNRAAPARDDRPARIRTRTNEVGARHAPLTPRTQSGRPGSNRPLRGGAPMLYPLSYVRLLSRFPGASLRARMPKGQCLGHTARRQEGAQRREAAAQPSPAREASAPGWSRTSARAVSEHCSPLSYGRPEPPAGVEPAPRPYKGRVLPLTLRRQRWRWQESNLRLLGASEVLCHQSFIPKMRTDGIEPPQPWAPGYSPESSPVLSVRM
jgi:hypothetical protein